MDRRLLASLCLLVFAVFQLPVSSVDIMEPRDFVANKDVALVVLQKKISSAKSPEEKEKLEKELAELMHGRELVRLSMIQIVDKATDSTEQAERVRKGKSSAYTTKIYKEVVEHYKEKCFNWHDQKYQTALQQLHLFANLIEEKVSVERIKAAIEEVGDSLKEKEKAAPSKEN